MTDPSTPPVPAEPTLEIVSFGYLHGAPPAEADEILDVRNLLRRDPAELVGLLDLDGHDQAVRDAVLGTPGAKELILAWAAATHWSTWVRDHTVVAVGCAGGRHRAPVIARALGDILAALGHVVRVRHRDMHHPRVLRAR